MTEEEFKKEMADREYERHRQRANFALGWLLLGLPLICMVSWPIGVVSILGTIAYFVLTHFLPTRSRPGQVPKQNRLYDIIKKDLPDGDVPMPTAEELDLQRAKYKKENELITIGNAAFPFPQSFKFGIGGYHGSAHQLRLVGSGELEYKFAPDAYQWEPPIVLKPDHAHWEEFWREMDSVGFWQWQPEYSRRCCDGTHWSICAQISNKSQQTTGSNAYPGSEDSRYLIGGQFDLFLKAMQKLTGVENIS